MGVAARIVVLLVLGAGCVAPEAPPAPAPAPPENVLAVPPRAGGDNPILASVDGALFVIGRNLSLVLPAQPVPTLLPGNELFRSDDGGRSWRAIGSPTFPSRAGDATLAVRDGRLWSAAGHEGCVTVARSVDVGASWSRSQACFPGTVDEPWLLPWGEGAALVARVLREVGGALRAELYAARTDDGIAWTLVGRVDDDEARAYPTDAVVSSDGSLVVAVSRLRDAGSDEEWSPGVVVSTDAGRTWTLRDAPTLHPGARRVAFGPADAAFEGHALRLAWAEDVGEETFVATATSLDLGATWAPPERLDSGEGREVRPTTHAVEGRAAVVWLQTGPAQRPQGDEGSRWNATVAWRTADGWAVRALSRDPLHVGPLCQVRCEEGVADGLVYHSLGATDLDGRLVAAWPRSTPEGPATVVAVAQPP